MLIPRLLRAMARDDSGFTLIELVVAMLISGVIVVVLLTVLTFTTRQTSLLTEKVQATRTGRQTLTKVLDELHSACLASGYTGYYPVRAESTPSTLIFYNAYSKQDAIPSASESAAEGVYEHELVFNEATGKLVDNSYPSTSVSAWPVPTFSKTPTSRLLGENLSSTVEVVEGPPKKETVVPTFQYFKYAKAASSTSSSTAGLETLEPMKLSAGEKLSEAQASEVTSVLVSFTASPSSHNHKLGRGISLSSQVTFAFTSPSAESTISDSPCE
jgi:prepilin-type N-terminal cleavage/methylation domain-containing protein